MKYLLLILVLFFFAVSGCLESSYKEVSPSQLLLNPKVFEGKKVCINGIFENDSISGITVRKTQNFTGEYKDWTLSNVCGTFKDGKLDADSVNLILAIFTEQDIYHSNETLKVHIDFNSQINGNGQVQVSGIKNAFDRALIIETREVIIKNGVNGFDFEFKTPSCEECSALAPGVHSINATVNIDSKTFETYKRITLEREK